MKKHIRLTMLALALASTGANALASPTYIFHVSKAGLKATTQELNPAASAAAAAVTLTPSQLDFGTVVVGETGSLTLIVSNTGNASTSVSVTELAAPFSRSGSTCGTTLAASASCTIGVIFRPTGINQATGTLTLTSSSGVGAQSVVLTGVGGGAAPAGQQAYTTAGTYSWTAPPQVMRVSVVAVGGGGSCSTIGQDGGAGAGLGWRNNIAVTPGSTYTVVVGAYGNKASNYGPGQAGGDSYFKSPSVVMGGGGGTSTGTGIAAVGGSFVGDGGGAGGAGGVFTSGYYAGGGGAGGYSGNGGAGASSGFNGFDGAGGGGGGGGSGNGSAGGGGVGLKGQGASGLHGSFGINWTDTGGQGGSGGNTGNTVIAGGAYGGGGGCAAAVNWSTGGAGAVRIIWGNNRAFPATNTADQ
jgi:hypothetical protein